jgi:hypothetical protein
MAERLHGKLAMVTGAAGTIGCAAVQFAFDESRSVTGWSMPVDGGSTAR